jgi:hypothetical protein
MGTVTFEDLIEKKHQIYDESRAKEKELIQQQRKAILEFFGDDEPKNVKIITHGGSISYYYQLIVHHTINSHYTEFTAKVSYQKKISFGTRNSYSSIVIETDKDYHLDVLSVRSIEILDVATITTKIVMAEKLIQLLKQ